MDELQDIIIRDTFDGLGTDEYNRYLAHALCLGGECRFEFNEKEFSLKEGDLMIVRKGKHIGRIKPSEDFRVKVVYVTPSFIELSTPQSNYGMKGQLALFLNPVMHLTEEMYALCRRGFDNAEFRLAMPDHKFYREVMRNVIGSLILDFFHFHSVLYQEDDVSTQNASIMSRFLTMLENGDFRKNREVSYYADKLCITPKYLSEVSNKVSGYPANYWINRYTMLDISRLLRRKDLTFVEISDMFDFSSPAHFSRYVQNYLGVRPSEYRK